MQWFKNIFGMGSDGKKSKSVKYVIININSGDILEECYTVRQAHRAQKRWYANHLWSGGVKTTVRAVYDGT